MIWQDLLEITGLSLWVTGMSVLVASLIAMPFGAWLAIGKFRARRTFIAIINALMGLPPVVVGLALYLLLSRAGPFRALDLLFTPWAMMLAQVIIILPIIASLSHQVIRDLWGDYRDLLRSLNATRRQQIAVLLWDGRRGLLTCALTGFGRAIGEVGAVMIVGGNIEHATRVLTTAITLETSKGNLDLAMALGGVLLAVSLGVSITLHLLAQTERKARW